MKNQTRGIGLLSVLILLGGCATPAPPPVVIEKPVVQEPPRPQISADALKVLTQIDAIQETLSQLRNAVDLQQYAQENSKRRQRQLYDDLDRRLRVLERTSPQLTNGSAATANPPAVTTNTSSVTTIATPPTEVVTPMPGSGGAISVTEPMAASRPIYPSQVVPSLPSATTTEAVTAGAMTAGHVTPGPALSAEQESRAQSAYDGAFELLRKSRYKEAIVALGQVVQEFPGSAVADDAQYWMAESYYVTREFEQALLGFRSVTVRYPTSDKAPQAVLKIGYIQYDMGAYERARQTLQEVLVRYPESRVAIAAKARLEKMQREGR